MPKYELNGRFVSYFRTTIEADNEHDAESKADELDSSDWSIIIGEEVELDDVVEVNSD